MIDSIIMKVLGEFSGLFGSLEFLIIAQLKIFKHKNYLGSWEHILDKFMD